MSTVSPRSDTLLPVSGQEAPPWTPPAGNERRPPAPAMVLRAQSDQEKAFAEAMANSGGLGDSAEEITFGASERAELEAHDETRDARERREERVEAAMRIEAIRDMMRQLSGEPAYASIRGRAERFASLWMRGNTEQAMAELQAQGRGPDRELLLRLALDRLPQGPRADLLDKELGELPEVSQALVRRLIDSASGSTPEGLATRTALQALTQAVPSAKMVFDAAGNVGSRGLDRLEKAAIPRGRVDPRCSRGAEVFLSLRLIRTIQQVRQVERASSRVMQAGACAGKDSAEEVRKTARWLLDVTGAAAPQAALGRMGVVLKVKAEELATAQRQLRREVDLELPKEVWVSADGRRLVQEELTRAITQDLEGKGLLNQAGWISGTARWRLTAVDQATAATPSSPDAASAA